MIENLEDYQSYLELERTPETARSYVSYLNSVTKELSIAIDRTIVPNIDAANDIVEKLAQAGMNPKYRGNCQAALRAYAQFVSHKNEKITIFRNRSTNALKDIDDIPQGDDSPDRADSVTSRIKRNDRVRNFVARKAKGQCEYCGAVGFITKSGKAYIEVHHIILLSEDGSDTVSNVIALCPNHHREAHFGIEGENLEREFIRIVKERNK